jgi:hypothetical protein
LLWSGVGGADRPRPPFQRGKVMNKNIVRARVAVVGTRPLLQHAFGPESIALEKREKEGVAGNDPSEWKRTCLVTPDGQLFIRHTYVFGCVRNGAKNVKKGRGSIQPLVAATLQVEEKIVLLDRWMPEGGPKHNDYDAPVYVDVTGVVNKATKGRNVRYRLACSPGWKCSFTLNWDRMMVSREQMKAAVIDAGRFAGLGDGLSVGNGRFEVESYEVLGDAEETTAARGVAGDQEDHLEPRPKKVRKVREAAGVDGVSR